MGALIPLPRPGTDELIAQLEQLIREVRQDRVIGLAWIVIRPGLKYEGDAIGAALDHPTFTRGALLTLSDELGRHILPPRE
jgi:hypothetical protein